MKRICWAICGTICGTIVASIVASLLAACSPAPEFIDSQGQPVRLAQFAGKPLLVNYFAPWCAPCLRELPRLEALAREGEIAVVAINYDPVTPAELGALASRYRIALPLLMANDEAALPFPPPTGLPTSYLLDGEGKLQETLVGELDKQQIASLKTRLSLPH